MSYVKSREIDELIATKVMEYQRVYDKQFKQEGWQIGEKHWTNWFSPSTNIQDAWKVVDKLKIAVRPQSDDAPANMKYQAEIDKQPLGNYYEAFAETAPMAICKVALKFYGLI